MRGWETREEQSGKEKSIVRKEEERRGRTEVELRGGRTEGR